MNGFRVFVDWIDGDRVRAPELRATWASIRIAVNGDDLTVAQDLGTESYRSTVYASAYPLAEWIAFNWWRLITAGGGKYLPAQRETSRRLTIQDAGDGFHWPDISFRPTYDSIDIFAKAHEGTNERVSYKIEGHWSVDRLLFERSMRAFVENVTDRLEKDGIVDTPLQAEWRAIHNLSDEQIEFCRAIAALGEDPFEPDTQMAEAVLLASQEVQSSDLLVEMLSATSADEVALGAKWLGESEKLLAQLETTSTSSELTTLRKDIPSRDRKLNQRYSQSPWIVGFQRARSLRSRLSVGLERVDLDSVPVARTSSASPASVEGVVDLESTGAQLVVSNGRSHNSERFLQARSLYRALYSTNFGVHIISNSNSTSEQIERAFAAEYLAPANGIAGALGRDYSDRSIARVARKYAVDVRVVEHQIENQIQN